MSPAKLVLLVEDETDLADVIRYNLEREGYACRQIADGDAAFKTAKECRPDLILLDRMLPGRPGDEIVAELRRDLATASIPIAILSAKTEETDQLVGFALGADDYITKPFSMKVLIARLGALLRRRAAVATDDDILTHGPFVLDPHRHEVRVDDQPVTLTGTEFRILAALMHADGRVLDRSRLIDKALGHGAVVTDRTIDVHITSLRRKISASSRNPHAAAYIHTVRGVGYAFREPETELATNSA